MYKCYSVTDILKMYMYLSEGKNCNVDEITAVSYLEAFFRSGCYGLFFCFFFFFKLST